MTAIAKPTYTMRTRVFTIPPSAPFLPTLIKAMTDGRLGFRLADDPLALAAAIAALLAAALAAGYAPARRASRIDPMAALRHE